MINEPKRFSGLLRRLPHYLKNRTLLMLVVLIIPFDCEHHDEPVIFVNDIPFYLKIGESVNINDKLSFSIEKIEDSRCPTGGECFWAGDVNLFFNIRQNSNVIDTTICGYSCHNNPFIIGGYTWKVLEVNPYPDIHRRIDQHDYRIKLIITEN
jgi:hypothetical protein